MFVERFPNVSIYRDVDSLSQLIEEKIIWLLDDQAASR